MDNRALIDRAKDFASSGDSYTGPEVRVCVHQLTDALERAEAELAKYRSAPDAGYLQGHAFYHKHQTRPVADEVQLIIRPEAP